MAAAGDVRAAAALVPRMVAVTHLLGTSLDARIGTLQAALDSLDGLAARIGRGPGCTRQWPLPTW